MEAAYVRAQGLPEEGCIEELVHRGDADGGLTKILNQKAATPHRVTSDPSEACTDMRPNIIMLQNDTQKERDETVADASAWNTLAQRMSPVSQAVITTGADMLEHLTPDFLSRAFPFVYKSQLAPPDRARRGASTSTLRRHHGGPEVSVSQHAYCFNRRVENQFRADWAHNYTQ